MNPQQLGFPAQDQASHNLLDEVGGGHRQDAHTLGMISYQAPWAALFRLIGMKLGGRGAGKELGSWRERA